MKPAATDYLHAAQSAMLGGFVGEKLAASYENRILAQDVCIEYIEYGEGDKGGKEPVDIGLKLITLFVMYNKL